MTNQSAEEEISVPDSEQDQGSPQLRVLGDTSRSIRRVPVWPHISIWRSVNLAVAEKTDPDDARRATGES